MVYTVLEHHFKPYPVDIAARQDVENFGRVANDWKTLTDALAVEVATCKEGEEIKVVFFQRHGHAIHNPLPVVMKPHWSRLLTTKRDPDALDTVLTSIGEEQVSHLAVKVKQEAEKGLPIPSKVFTSVARRTCQTTMGTWGDIVPSERINIVHDLRDHLKGRQLARRLPLSELKPLFPDVSFDKDIPEDDIYWDTTGGTETHEAFMTRVTSVFDDIWNRSKGSDCISIVAHLDVFEVLWPESFGLEKTSFEKGEMRVLVIKSSSDSEF